MDIKKILFPTDFSKTADEALPHALTAAQKYDAEITMLHVRMIHQDDPTREEQQLLEQGDAQGYLKRTLGRAEGKSERIKAMLMRDYDPAYAILNFIKENEIDLTVMGTHGRSAIGHFFLGSVAEQVVRHAECPVLTVAKSREDYSSKTAYESMLIAFDFSEHSEEAARQARDLARQYKAKLHALYVLTQEIPPIYAGIWKKHMVRDLPEITEATRRFLQKTLGENETGDLEVHVKIAEQKAHTGIVEFAREKEIDLIVMGTHGRSGLDRMLLGSTTERVVRVAPCPVLTFKLP